MIWASMGQRCAGQRTGFAKAVAESWIRYSLTRLAFAAANAYRRRREVVGIDRIQPVLVGMQWR